MVKKTRTPFLILILLALGISTLSCPGNDATTASPSTSTTTVLSPTPSPTSTTPVTITSSTPVFTSATPSSTTPTEPPLTPITLPAWTHEEHQEGDLIVEGEQDYLIEDAKLLVDGNIIIRDSATMTIRNTELTLNSSYKGEYQIFLHDQATLVIEGCWLRDAYTFGSAEVWDIILGESGFCIWSPEAKVVIRDTLSDLRLSAEGDVTIESSRLSLVLWEPTARLSITKSDIFLMNIRFWGESETINISGLKGSQTTRIPKTSFSAKEGGLMSLENSLIANFSLCIFTFYQDERSCDKHLVIKDCEFADIWACFPYGSDVTIDDLGPGFFEQWKLADCLQGSGVPWNLELEKSVIDKWKLDFQGTATLENVEAQVDTYGDGTVTINNSKVLIYHGRGGILTINNSLIMGPMRFMYWDATIPGEYLVEFSDTVLSAEAGLEFSHMDSFLITGTVTFEMPPENINWAQGVVVREYPVIVKGGGNLPLAGALLILKDAESQEIWSGVTGNDGTAVFEISFTRDTYLQSYTLIAKINSAELSQTIGFLTDSPIDIVFIQ